jgi:hypothetical protein
MVACWDLCSRAGPNAWRGEGDLLVEYIALRLAVTVLSGMIWLLPFAAVDKVTEM